MTGSTAWLDSMGHMDDASDGPELVARIAQICGGPLHRERDRELLPLLEPRPGQAVLEVGCGTGVLVRELVQLTGGQVPVTGVDPSRLALDQAESDTAAASLGPLTEAITYRQMDGRALAFPDASFAAAYSSRVLIHAAEPARIVLEMARVVQPGGRILCIEPLVQVATGVDDALRRKVTAWTNPDVARELPALLREAGLQNVTVTPHVALSTEPPDVDAWREDFRAGRGRHIAAVRDGRCTTAELMEFLDQNEAAVRRGAVLECLVHYAVVGTRAPA
jgi:ubiquinone/menaquinone biosynthesis C-methylase UbiE